MKKFTTSLLASGAFFLCVSTGNVFAQVPVQVSPEHSSYETMKNQWISDNPTAYEAMQNNGAQAERTVKAQNVASDDAAYEAKKIARIKAEAQANATPAKIVRRPAKNFTPNTGIVSESQIQRAGGDYDNAKEKWVKENPEAYKQLTQPKSQR